MTMLGLFAAVLALVLINVPIAVSLGIVAVTAMVATHGTGVLPNLAVVTYNGATSFPLLAIPLFILAGSIMNASGISRRLIAFASSVFGWIRGGLAHVSIGASLFFAEISGSAVADVAALGSILIPGMKAKGYPAPLAAAVMSSAATLAVIIPPSIPMILYAVMAETSVVQLFVAGIVPGVIGGLGLMAMAYYFARRYDLPQEAAFSWSRVAATARDAVWAFLLPIIILGGIFGGVVTAMVATHGTGVLPNLAVVTYNGATSFPLLAIPLFILAGSIMNASGISRRLIAFASSVFGWIRGGLAHVSIGASLFFAEISGSAVADVAALGSILIPGMKAKGYPANLAAAVMSSSATLAVIIPPSIPMILYAVMAETS
ncbi:MAG TPA: TRAP transporter large permease subunit, partial [Casimicrobiaceae bacterium]